MPTLEALETAIADYKRTQTAFAELVSRRNEALAQLNTVNGQIATAQASAKANEETLRTVSKQFAEGNR